MPKTPTIYQKLTKAMFGGGVQLNNSDMNQSKSITVNSYHMNPNSDDIIFRTKDKEEYEQQLLQKKQQKLLNNMWVKANVQLANNSLKYIDATTFSLMDAFEPLSATIGSVLIFHLQMTGADILGSILVIVAVLAINIRIPQKKLKSN